MSKEQHFCKVCGSPMVKTGVTNGGKTRWLCRRDGVYCSSTTDPDGPLLMKGGKPAKLKKDAQFHLKLGKVRKLVITSAQNATPVHNKFLGALLTYCEHNDAELVVIPFRYRNPTSVWSERDQEDDWWADDTLPYLHNQRKKLCDNLMLLADIKAQPTAASPLTGFEGLTRGESGIIGHARRQLRCIATPSHLYPKVMATTGAVTVPNYTDTKAGAKGEFHHTLGALVVELDGKQFHMRQITANSRTGEFYDWDRRYGNGNITASSNIPALIMGDIHHRFMDTDVEKATFGPGGIAEQLNPEHVVYHDLFDGYAVNPHDKKDPFIAMAKSRAGFSNVKQEVEDTIDWLADMTAPGRKSVVVASNHNDFLRRWIIDTDWRTDPINGQFYLETALAMAKATKMSLNGSMYPDPFIYWARKFVEANPQFKETMLTLDADQSFEVKGVELGFHGHRGPNGARGSIKNMDKIGVKSVIGHSHTPGIEGGVFQTGTSSRLQLDYNEGPSSWLPAHVVVYPDGKRSLVNIVEGKFKR